MCVVVFDWKIIDDYVSIINGFYFVYVIIFDDGIKYGVQRI